MTTPLPTTSPVVVEDSPVGWTVYVHINEDAYLYEAHFECRERARAYAKGLSRAGGYPIEDQSTDLPGWETAVVRKDDRVASKSVPYSDSEGVAF